MAASSTNVDTHRVYKAFNHKVKKPLEPFWGAFEDTAVLSCAFDIKLEDTYFVIWRVGPYTVQFPDTRFKLLFAGSDALLIIYSLQPIMRGPVTCELHICKSPKRTQFINETSSTINVTEYCLPSTNLMNNGQVLDFTGIYAMHMRPRAGWKPKTDPVSCSYLKLEVNFCKLNNGLYFVRLDRFDKENCRVDFVCYKESNPAVNASGRREEVIVFEWVMTHPDGVALSASTHRIMTRKFTKGFFGSGFTTESRFRVVDPPVEELICVNIGITSQVQQSSIRSIAYRPYATEPLITSPQYLKSLQNFYRDFLPLKLIGSGVYGKVMLIRSNAGKQFVAKTVISQYQTNSMEEYSTLRILRNTPNIVKLIECYSDGLNWVFVMENLWGGNLFDRFKHHQCISERDIKIYLRQVCSGLQYIHNNGLIHFDIKPENVMCCSLNCLNIKIIDFGLTKCARSRTPINRNFGFFSSVAPELYSGNVLTTAYDMWSVGILMGIGLLGYTPRIIGKRSRRLSVVFTSQEYLCISGAALHFFGKCLHTNPSRRLTAAQALNHPWMFDTCPHPLSWKKPSKNRRYNRYMGQRSSYGCDYLKLMETFLLRNSKSEVIISSLGCQGMQFVSRLIMKRSFSDDVLNRFDEQRFNNSRASDCQEPSRFDIESDTDSDSLDIKLETNSFCEGWMPTNYVSFPITPPSPSFTAKTKPGASSAQRKFPRHYLVGQTQWIDRTDDIVDRTPIAGTADVFQGVSKLKFCFTWNKGRRERGNSSSAARQVRLEATRTRNRSRFSNYVRNFFQRIRAKLSK